MHAWHSYDIEVLRAKKNEIWCRRGNYFVVQVHIVSTLDSLHSIFHVICT